MFCPGLVQLRRVRTGLGLCLGEAGGELLSLSLGAGTQPFQFGGGAGTQLLELAGGVFPCPRGFRAGGLGEGSGRSGALPGLLGLGAGLVPGGLGGANEGLGVGAGPLDRFPRCRFRAGRARPGVGDGGGLVRLGLADGLVTFGRCGADPPGGVRLGLLDPGGGVRAGLPGLLEGVGGALFSLLAGGLGGLQPLIHLRRGHAGLFGIGLGLLAALRLAAQLAVGVGDLRDRLGLHCLDLRLGRYRVRGGLQLLGGRGELGHQAGRVGQQARPQLGRAGGGHGDRPVQVRLGRRAPGRLAVQCLAGPERRHRGVLVLSCLAAQVRGRSLLSVVRSS